jgi:spermidine synthase
MMGATVEYYREGRGATVSVVEGGGQRALLINGKVVATDNPPDMEHELLLGHIPALLHPNPKSTLVVGLGAGITLGAVAAHRSIDQLVLVEIEPAVVEAASLFRDANDEVLDDPRLVVVIEDGRNFLKTTHQEFDVITADPIHPWAAGAAYLYTTEYYRTAAEHLGPRGIMCQWLPAYELSPENFKSAVATFAASFAHTTLWQATSDVILIGSELPLEVDLRRLERRLAEPPVGRQLGPIGLKAPLPFLAQMALDDAGVREYASGSVINTDDNLYLEFSTPHHIGSRKGFQNMRAIEEYRTGPEAVISSFEPFFVSREEARAVLQDYQSAKSATVLSHLEAAYHREVHGLWGFEAVNRRLRRVLVKLPGYDPARTQLAANLASLAAHQYASGLPRPAIANGRRALELAPDRPGAHHTLGMALARLGEFDQAIEHFEAAVRLRPGYWVAHHHLSEALMDAERYSEAIHALRRGLEIRPNHPVMRRRLDELLSIESDGTR